MSTKPAPDCIKDIPDGLESIAANLAEFTNCLASPVSNAGR